MKNKRLLQIASLITKDDNVVDIGCDHGYLAIYLKKKKKCTIVIASDVNENALNVARKNIAKEELSEEITCICSNGLENIPMEQINTIVIAGLGTRTILNILNHPKIEKVKRIIIQSNNEYEFLRRNMNKKGYQIINEIYLEEKGHDYFIIEYQEGQEKLSKMELTYGKKNVQNQKYYEKCMENIQKIESKIPRKKWLKILSLKRKRRKLRSYIKSN